MYVDRFARQMWFVFIPKMFQKFVQYMLLVTDCIAEEALIAIEEVTDYKKVTYTRVIVRIHFAVCFSILID